MNETTFWRIIEESKAGTSGLQREQKLALKKTLTGLDATEIVAFDKIFDRMLFNSFTWDLWGAAYIIDGGCSDDGFEYFRRGLVASGREKFERALQDADTLAEWAEADEIDFEDIKYVISDVYAEKTGKSSLPPHDLEIPEEPSGEDWDEDSNDLKRRFPLLWEKFGA